MDTNYYAHHLFLFAFGRYIPFVNLLILASSTLVAMFAATMFLAYATFAAYLNPEWVSFVCRKCGGKWELFGSTHLSEVSRKCTLTGLSHQRDERGSRKIVPGFVSKLLFYLRFRWIVSFALDCCIGVQRHLQPALYHCIGY